MDHHLKYNYADLDDKDEHYKQIHMGYNTLTPTY
jgi:hypothetical protein